MSASVLALVTARGGSKGIPGKNIRAVGGKPLLAWSIEAAKAARCVERVVLSTDSVEIRDIGVRNGAEAPFLRPPELAGDATPGVAPVLHAVRWLEEHERYRSDIVILLQPTTPLRLAQDIDAAMELARQRQAEAVVSVCPVSKHPFWMKKITADGYLEDIVKTDGVYTRRQDLPPAYALNGSIYLIRRETLLSKETLFPPQTIAYVMPPERSLEWIPSSICGWRISC
ncbi:MAG: acylneuraminate cytidylyltransferase family protein [Planctomycetota bacterium]